MARQPVDTLADLSLEFEDADQVVVRTLEAEEDASGCAESPSEMGVDQTGEGASDRAKTDACMAEYEAAVQPELDL